MVAIVRVGGAQHARPVLLAVEQAHAGLPLPISRLSANGM